MRVLWGRAVQTLTTTGRRRPVPSCRGGGLDHVVLVKLYPVPQRPIVQILRGEALIPRCPRALGLSCARTYCSRLCCLVAAKQARRCFAPFFRCRGRFRTLGRQGRSIAVTVAPVPRVYGGSRCMRSCGDGLFVRLARSSAASFGLTRARWGRISSSSRQSYPAAVIGAIFAAAAQLALHVAEIRYRGRSIGLSRFASLCAENVLSAPTSQSS